MLGFDTIGNATLIVYDEVPVLVTDPWITGSAYFGSWGRPYETPKEQMDHILNAKYIWYSHGHPDHINGDSLDLLAHIPILLPDHVGGRMLKDLRELGFNVKVLPDSQWVQLSTNLRVMCISDYTQDAILLVDINGTLVINLNDATERGWGGRLKKIISSYKTSFLLKLIGYGDVDMLNIHDEEGHLLMRPPPTAATQEQWTHNFQMKAKFYTDLWKPTYMVPFSIFHRYQRTDSIWVEPYATPLDEYKNLRLTHTQVLAPFIRYNAENGDIQYLNPNETEHRLFTPEELNDSWDETLTPQEIENLRRYFTSMEILHGHIDFVDFVVGGKRTHIQISPADTTKRGLSFAVPRNSLNLAVKEQIFDDLLIGNFMKTTLHGDWGIRRVPEVLYEHFSPIVTRFADNAYVKTKADLKTYMKTYAKRNPVEFLKHYLEAKTTQRLRRFLHPDSQLFKLSTKCYSLIKRV